MVIDDYDYEVYYCKKCQSYSTVKKQYKPGNCYFCGNNVMERVTLIKKSDIEEKKNNP